VSEIGIPCLFKYFTQDWKQGFAFISNEGIDKNKNRAYIALEDNKYKIKFYCHHMDSNFPSIWIPNSPVLREIYDL
jgi:hypothetical protein